MTNENPKTRDGRWFVLGLASLLGLVLAGGCESDADDEKVVKKSEQASESEGSAGDSDEDFVAGSEAEHFTFALETAPESLDPTQISGVPGGRVAFNIFEGLLMPAQTTKDADSPRDLVRPGVAKEWEVSEDGLTYTFHLRDDAKWSNGEPVTARDFVFSWKRTLLPGYPADYKDLFDVIEGVPEYRNAKTESTWENVGIKAPDEHTIKIELRYPAPYFPELVAFYTYFPQPKRVVEAYPEKWTRPEHIQTNGPYRLVEYDADDRIVLEKNDEYWDADSVSIDRAVIRIIEDPETLVEEYEAEKLHWTGRSLTPWQVPDYRDRPDFHEENTLGTYYLRVNVSKNESVLSKSEFRRVLRYALDRERIVEETLNGVYNVADSYVPDGMPKYSSTHTVSYDLEKAKSLLEEMGVENAGNFGTIKLLYPEGRLHERVVNALRDQLSEDIGLNLKLEAKPWPEYLDAIDVRAYELARSGWVGDFNDPMTFLDMWTSDSGNNDTGWANGEYDEYISSAKSAEKSPERTKQLLKAEKVLLEEGPAIPIYHYADHVLVGTNVKGYKPHSRNIHLLKDISVSGE